MPDASVRFSIRVFQATEVWTGVVTDNPANTWEMFELDGKAFMVCTDPANVASQRPIPAGAALTLLTPHVLSSVSFPGERCNALLSAQGMTRASAQAKYGTRFLPGDIIVYVKSADSNPVNIAADFAV